MTNKKEIKQVKDNIGQYQQSRPTQLSLFEREDDQSDIYSNTIEFYDYMPKHYWGGARRDIGRNVDALPILTREFIHRKKSYRLEIAPAALIDKKSGKTRHYYPSQREELIEDAIRKLAVNKRGIYLDTDAAVKFTLYELQKELQRCGHGYNIAEIKQGIEICNRSIIDVTDNEGNKVSMSSPIFPFVGIENGKEEANLKDRVVVMFHPLVTKSIEQRTYRLYNYDQVMSYKMSLSRYLHKRISHIFTQAGADNPYPINMSTIVRDSGMKEYAKKILTLNQIIKSLEEMKDLGTLSKYTVERETKGRIIIDAKFLLYVSDEFVSDIKKASKLTNIQIESSNSTEFAANLDKIREELGKKIYQLTITVINNIIANIKTVEEQEIVLKSLAAAKQYIENNPNCNNVAITKAAIREGWEPRKLKSISTDKTDKDVSFPVIKKFQKQEGLERDPKWLKSLKSLKSEFGVEVFDKWFSTMFPHSLVEGDLIIMVETKFLRDWITKEFLDKKNSEKTLQEVISRSWEEIKSVKVICE